MTKRLKSDFRELNGHIDQLSDEEATIEIQEGKDPHWITIWNNSRKYSDNDGKTLVYISLDLNDNAVFRDLDANDFITGAELKRLFLEEYAFYHEREREVNQEYLKKVIAKYSQPRNPRGAPQKQPHAKSIMQVLTNVIWTEYCFTELDKGKTAFDLKITNEDYRFFFKVFNAWGLFEAFQINITKTYKVEKYLREIFSPDPDEFTKDICSRLLDLQKRTSI